MLLILQLKGKNRKEWYLDILRPPYGERKTEIMKTYRVLTLATLRYNILFNFPAPQISTYRTSKKDFAYIRIMDEWKLFFSWSLIKTLLLASSVFYEWMEQYHGWMKTGKSSRKVTFMSLANLFGHGQSWAQKEIKTLTNIRFQSPNFLTCFKSEIKAKMTYSLTFWDL